MSISRWSDKEDMVHVHSGMLLSHKKEWSWVICKDVDEPRICHTEWSKSEREKQVYSLWMNIYLGSISLFVVLFQY